MCGIAGIVSKQEQPAMTGLIKAMTTAIAHRGPDGEAHWLSKQNNVALGHRRLAIIDLSAAAAQPIRFIGRNGHQYCIIHNGEIYNYVELKEFLFRQGYGFSSAGDTEVLMAAYDYYQQNCLQYLDGMFAFVIWNETTQTLFAARDRFGEKPFYHHYENDTLYFASEMKALWAAGISKEPDDELLLHYLANGHNQLPLQPERSFYKKIFSLPAGHYLQWQVNVGPPEIAAWYDLEKAIIAPDSETNTIARFEQLFTESISRRLRSDVPVGTSLSGGLDSSAIAAFCKKTGGAPYTHHAFTAVFPGHTKDEQPYAQQVVEHLGMQAHTTAPTGEGLADELEKLFWHHEQPSLSASVYAQYKVFELAKEHSTTVLLDGQGADELLAGYHKYIHWYLQDLRANNKKNFAKEMAALRHNDISFRWGLMNWLAVWLPNQAAQQLEKKEVHTIKYHRWLNADWVRAHYKRTAIHKPTVLQLNDLLYFNTRQLGLEELLRYADRNSMTHGREVRLPFLSHELVAFIFSLPPTYKIHEGYTKWILRKAAAPLLPDNITWRKDKVGYEPPQEYWLRNPALQQRIAHAKEVLVKKGMLQKKVIDTTLPDDFAWRVLCAGMLKT
jgi:asparagine synthase (glutamine-hydrolysing)